MLGSITMTIYRVRHIKCYRAIALKLLIISKKFSDKSCSVPKGRLTSRIQILSVFVMFTAFPQHHQHIKIFLKIVHFCVPMYSH